MNFIIQKLRRRKFLIVTSNDRIYRNDLFIQNKNEQKKLVRNNLPVVEVFVRLFVDGAVVVSVEQFAAFRTPEKGIAKRGHENMYSQGVEIRNTSFE